MTRSHHSFSNHRRCLRRRIPRRHAEEVLEAFETSEAYNFVSRETTATATARRASVSSSTSRGRYADGLVDDRATLSVALKSLDTQEQHVLSCVIRGSLLTEIATMLGLSQMQVSRLLRRTLRCYGGGISFWRRSPPGGEPPSPRMSAGVGGTNSSGRSSSVVALAPAGGLRQGVLCVRPVSPRPS
jgi:hypothetical protein